LGEPGFAPTHLEVDFRHRIGSLEMDVRFKTSAPWTVLFGASGSGKSTILRVVAGLERAGKGKNKGGTQRNAEVAQRDAEECFVKVMGRVVSGAGVWMPAHERPVRWAGQSARLMPQKTALQNVAMGGGSRETLDAMRHFDLGGVWGKRPGQLSGGQRQMVSVIRAAVGARGRLLLLDEPFAGLDAKVRDALIGNLRSWLGDTPVVSVTHDGGEAFVLGAEVVRIAEGRVVAQGPVAEVLAEERKRLLGVLG
jgi:molybdate transport system ATP-binding protein